MSKRILILSYYFSPGNLMGAVRPSKLAKHISKLGYDVEVIASLDNRWLFLNNEVKDDKILINDVKDISIHRLPHTSIYRLFARSIRFLSSRILSVNQRGVKAINSEASIHRKSIKYFLKKNLMFFMSLIQDLDFLLVFLFSRNLKSVVRSSDVIVSTYGPYASHFVAYYLKKKLGEKVKWIADFRDPISQATDTPIQKKINKIFENKICDLADVVVAVSNGYLNEITGTNYEKKTQVITNGFDADDLSNINFKQIKNNKFIISYTGTTYKGKRDLRPVLKSLVELIDENLINDSMIEFHYAGPEADFIQTIFEKYNLSKILKNFGLVERQNAIQISYHSNLIIVATWDSHDNTGVLPGKFFESMMFGKPLVVLVNSETKGSEIVQITKKYKLGITHEGLANKGDISLLKEFIHHNYLNKFLIGQNEDTLPLNENPFNYQNIAKSFVNLF